MARFILCLAAATASLVAAQATAGDFNVLTFNVAGLPAILQGNDVPGDKTTNTRIIGSKFAQFGYDVINVQEDFNYHATLYDADNHPFRTSTSGGVPFGSGMNTLANFNWVDFTRVKWNTCSNTDGADCLTPKGFTFMRVLVSEGVYIDMYNLHADAGTTPADLTARAANIQQVADYINTWSAGNAVVVFGDTNSRYTRVADRITVFQTQNGLTDAWVQLVRGGVNPEVTSVCTNPSTIKDCEIVDKVLYRGSNQLSLQATDFNYEGVNFLQPNGSILSDHNPILVNFTWTAGSSYRQSNFWGGPHGTWFNDLPSLPTSTKPTVSVLTFSGGSRVDSVGVTLASGTVFKHGGSGGTASSLTLAGNEYWTSTKLCQGQKDGNTRIFYILATTNTGRTLSAGKSTSDCATFTAPSGWQVVGFNGQSGTEVDQLALIYAPS